MFRWVPQGAQTLKVRSLPVTLEAVHFRLRWSWSGHARTNLGDNVSATLVDGQRLDQPTFHSRYEAMPPGTRAELIHGVVLMPSPVGPPHGRASLLTLMWLGFYQANTAGVEALVDTSTALGLKSEPQPDALLRIVAGGVGRTTADQRFVRGVPELLVEVAHTTRFTDLGPKFEDYERVGVLEYVVRSIEPDEVYWFILRNG